MYGNSIWDDIKWQYKFGSDLIRLILINVAVFISIQLFYLIGFFLQQSFNPFIAKYFFLHADLSILLVKPWQLITYMFIHEGFWHILWNMLTLYWFGNIVGDLIGKSKIIPLYILGGIAGGLLYILAYNTLPVFSGQAAVSAALGASAGVTAIVMAATTISPNYEIRLFLIGPIKLKWLTTAYILLDLFSIQYGNAGGHITHLGGFFLGWMYIVLLQKSIDLARPFYAIQDFIATVFSKKNKLKVSYKKEKTTQSTTAQSYKKENTVQLSKQERLDSILDKINKSSYDSLTPEEKNFLFQVSKED